jgi:arylsulfatase A-like enzyme
MFKKNLVFSVKISCLILFLICVIGSLCLCSSNDVQSKKRVNIILVSEDQLAARHIHSYGYHRNTTPHLDRMTEEGVLFTRFYASGSWTTPSYPSMMTGLFPSQHQMTLFVRPGAPTLDPGIPLLAEQFEKAGYHTVAFCNNGNAGQFILGRGFKEFYQGQRIPDNITEREDETLMDFRAPGTNKKIFSWLEKNKDIPFFMFILYFEPHSPYDPPSEHDIFKTDAYPEETHTGYDPLKGKLLRFANAGDKRAVQRLIDLYDGKVHFIDYHFGKLLNKIENLGLDDKTIIILLSDHGELLYSHKDVLTFDHRSLYDTNIHVPLVIKGPGISQGKKINAMASHIDIPPTILDLAGLPHLKNVPGESLLPLIRGSASSVHDYIFAEQDVREPRRSVRNERYKLIYTLRTGQKQLFNTLEDPEELNDLSENYPEITERLFEVLKTWMKENHPPEETRLNRWKKVVEHRFKTNRDWIVDEVAIGALMQLNGSGWKMADSEDNYLNACYWIESGNGERSAVWRTDNPLLGKFKIYVWYGSIPGRKSATDAAFKVTTEAGEMKFVIDQNLNKGQWNLLGTFFNPVNVRVTDKADGPVVVDAVKFEWQGE